MDGDDDDDEEEEEEAEVGGDRHVLEVTIFTSSRSTGAAADKEVIGVVVWLCDMYLHTSV